MSSLQMIRSASVEKEHGADKRALKGNANFILKQYWYARPMISPAAKICRLMIDEAEAMDSEPS
jgi:hypothetical protein